MKEYFRILVEGRMNETLGNGFHDDHEPWIDMHSHEYHKKPKLLAPDIIPTGKFFIHPDTGMVMLPPEGMETHPGYHHNQIAAKYGLKNTIYAQSEGWVRGEYKQKHMYLEGYHGHEVLRGVLSRFSHLFPHDAQFSIENYDREYGKMDSREFTGTEALNQYIQGGRINPIVAPTPTSTPTDYEVEKELRRTVPESQRTFESFTFSKLRTQLNEEHKDLIAEMHPIMFIHTDPTIPTYHVVAGDTNRQTHDELAKDAIEDHYTKRPSGNLSDQLLSLGPWTRIHTYPAPRVLGIIGQKSFEIESASHEALRDTLRRIEPHISGHKVHIAVRDFGSGGEWSKRVDAEQLRDYIKYGHQARSLRVESWQEYDAKVGETNTSLFEPGNTKFDMKAFLKKLRKKYGVKENLPGEN